MENPGKYIEQGYQLNPQSPQHQQIKGAYFI